ncbi:MAG: Uma2 family endonuclease [Eubacterium sp.]|nr:Uma2 family endonuclease [Eubacterium sp.]
MTINEMIERKRELGYTNKMISEKTGLPLGTIQKIFSGKTVSPRKDTIQALESLLRPRFSYDAMRPETDSAVRDALASYGSQKKPGEYTLEDYLALPEDLRVELIDGYFYDMGAPTTWHQAIAGYIHKLFLDFVLTTKGPCYPFISPVDVQLDRDDKTVVQPDVAVVCDRDKYKNGRIFGAPDLVIEVLSPSTRKKDLQLKVHKYGNAGVREYWIVDPKNKAVIQYDLEHLNLPSIFTFADKVPVLIWDGKCVVDFSELYDSVSFLME